jgi:hypothetical protein
LAGPTDNDGDAIYLAQSFIYTSSYSIFDESNGYIWSIAPIAYCNSSGDGPGIWLGNWSSSEHEYGPYLRRTKGARAFWAR